MITKTFEPIRPLHAPDDGAYAGEMIFGGWRVYYGESHWPSRSYWLVPGTVDPGADLPRGDITARYVR